MCLSFLFRSSLYFALVIVLYWCFRDLQWGMCRPTQARGVRPKASTCAMPLSWPIHTGKCSYGVGLSRFPMSAICLPTMVIEVCSKGLEPSSYTRERYFTISISKDRALGGGNVLLGCRLLDFCVCVFWAIWVDLMCAFGLTGANLLG